MLINSIISRNRHSSRVRRNSRRDNRRRFFIFVVPLLFIGLLANVYFSLVSAADGEVSATLVIDISKYDHERQREAEPNIGNITSSIAQLEIFIDHVACSADEAYESPISITESIYNSSTNQITRTLNLTPGRHCIDYIVQSAEGIRYSGHPSRWWVWGYYFDSYYRRPESKATVDYYSGEYVARYDEIEVTTDGQILDAQGNPYKITIEPYSDPENTVKVPYELKSYKDYEIPKDEKLVVDLYQNGGSDLLARKSVDITSTGMGEVVFHGIERDYPINYYYMNWYVVDKDGNVDQNWSNAQRQGSYYIVNDELLPVRYNCSYYNCYTGNNALALTSTYRRPGNDDYFDKVSRSENENATNEFHLAQSANDIVHSGHYIIVAKNNIDGAYYALSANNNSYATKLTDLNDSNLNSYKISDETLKKSDYVYTVRWPEYDGVDS